MSLSGRTGTVESSHQPTSADAHNSGGYVRRLRHGGSELSTVKESQPANAVSYNRIHQTATIPPPPPPKKEGSEKPFINSRLP